MTKSKKSIVMHGTLLAPLVLGHCAYLRANGSDYRTSPVVAIHEQSGDLVHFETLNSCGTPFFWYACCQRNYPPFLRPALVLADFF